MNTPEPAPPATRSDAAVAWATRTVSGLGLVVCVWAAIAAGDVLVHGHPAYAVFLGIVFLASAFAAVRAWPKPRAQGRRFKVLRWVALAASCGVLASVWWLVPYRAIGPAHAAMKSDATVAVTETAGRIVMAPVKNPGDVGVFFQPGALVDARAYAAILRPLAEAGHTVVIPKQPFGIAFLATGAFSGARSDHPPVIRWVVGGHSLGGVVSANDAASFAAAADAPVAGLLFFASYPATDVSVLNMPVLSISGSNDGLSTPEEIDASRDLLPPGTRFTEIEGATHASFGDYGRQAGDGFPSIPPEEARTRISGASMDFLDSLDR